MESLRLDRLAGLIGLAGATLFFVGDMLFNGHWGSGKQYASGVMEVVRGAPLERLFAGGLVGPLAACLCMIGFWHVYQNVRIGSRNVARILLASAWVFWVIAGAVHLLWTARALALRFCIHGQSDCLNLQQAIKESWSLGESVAAIPGYLLAILLAYLVVFGKTCYPRWTVIANPAIWLWLLPLLPRAPAPFGSILVGGGYNLPWIAFFVTCVLTSRKNLAGGCERR